MRPFNAFEEREIARFLGVPDEENPPRNRPTKSIGNLVDVLVDRYHLDRETPEETILQNWPHIVGENFSKRCYPERITASGTLIVAVPNTVVRRELMFMETRILTAIGSLQGCEHIRSVTLKSGL